MLDWTNPASASPPVPWTPCRRRSGRGGLAAAATVMLALAACMPAADGSGPQSTRAASANAATDSVSVTTDSVNYRHDRAMRYTLYDLSKTPPLAVGGAIVEMLGTGGEKGCCVSLPKNWRPGMKVRVDWDESDRKAIYPEKYGRELEIPRYDAPADVVVVFYPEHDVEVVVSAAEPGHPEWRGRISKTPWEQCLETYGRKPCKAALPKMFDTHAVGMCTWLKEEDRPNGDDTCAYLMDECMKDWEDQQFCDGILWAPTSKK
jgi:hypothetical protein